ncbi:hypothetical protein ANANG_G00091700 [Anguilla anguilla]|uniref:Groucho/TLE N-terminal Q-rich domain-containing protein n=1 Tax=Anguilla anguilla TaxID=7936 RepID=A0A9D3MQ66_ANGAN|nr:hypothetical protein ANANG_G00091700 [Anguilla anguilla]
MCVCELLQMLLLSCKLSVAEGFLSFDRCSFSSGTSSATSRVLCLGGAAAAAAAAAASGTPQSLKLTYPETLDRIKEEFQFLQTQYHSLKLECEKLATEKTEIQRHYVMYYEMSYGLNIEMHKQTEIAKRLNVICAQLIPFLSQEHQQQVVQAMERAKQVTMGELNASIGQQLQAQHLSQHAAQGLPMAPHPSGLQHPGLALGGGSGLLALSGPWGPSWRPRRRGPTWRPPPPLPPPPPPPSTTEVWERRGGGHSGGGAQG